MQPTLKSTAPVRNFRPLGLTLAILAVFVVFGFLPIVPTIFVLMLGAEGHPLAPDDALFWLSPLLGLVVMVLSVFAWIGRPARIRGLFLAASALALAADLYATFRPGVLSFNSGISGGSLDSLFQNALLCLIPVRVLILLYTIWYVNRAPARAYYDLQNSKMQPPP